VFILFKATDPSVFPANTPQGRLFRNIQELIPAAIAAEGGRE
jgi:hypothetical protein